MGLAGKRIVLAASNSESSEFMRSTWWQMLLATLPTRYVRYLSKISVEKEKDSCIGDEKSTRCQAMAFVISSKESGTDFQ